MNRNYAKDAINEVIRDFCRLVDSGVTIDRDSFHDICEKEGLTDFLLSERAHSGRTKLYHLDENSPLFDAEIKAYVNNAFGRHANVVVMEDFGLKNNALLLGINISLSILRELDSMT